MGAIQKESVITGNTLGEAFLDLQQSDERTLGNDIYNGGWNNATGIREVSSEEFKKVYDNQDITKHESVIAKCIKKPVINTNKIKTSVLNFPIKGARKWITKYVAENEYGQEIVNEKSQTEAIKKARSWVEKNPKESLSVHIKKELLGVTKVAEINYKKSTKEAPGTWKIYGCLSY